MTNLNSFDRVAHVYDETRGLPPAVAATVADGLAAIFRRAAAAPRIVEPGVGTGRMAAPLAERGVRVLGLDIAPKMLAVLREKNRDVDIALAEAAHPPLRPAAFDGLLFVHILHLVPDAEATLAATLPLVRPGGVAVHARDERSRGIVSGVEEIVERIVREVTGVTLPSWDRHEVALQAFRRAVESAGASPERRTLARWQATFTARRFLERLQRRDFSGAWSIPEEALPAVVERATTEIAALAGGLDREVPYEHTFSATSAWLPAAPA